MSELLDALNASAATFAEANHLYRRVGDNLLTRLEPIQIEPQRILDLGCATGELLPGLHEKFPNAKLYALDQAEARVALAAEYQLADCQVGNVLQLPYPDQHFDLVVSNLMLHWVDDVATALAEIQRVLTVDGLLLFSYYGPNTYQTLGKVMAHCYDMHDVGDALVYSRFNNPVLDVEHFAINYSNVDDLLADLADTADNALVSVQEDVVLSVPYEIVYGHAWKLAAPMTSKMDSDGTVHISIKQIQRK